MTDTAIPPRSRAFMIVMALVTLLAFVTLLALGTWQVQRLAWKEDLLATIDARIHAAPITLDELNRRDDIEYVPVRVSGHFDHAAERHFFTTYEGMSGYNVYTPLIMGNGEAVFVNRGFVPFDRKDAAGRAQGQIAGEVQVTGLARKGLAEKPSFAVPDNDPAKNIFYWKDIRQMRETSGLPADVPVLGYFIDADATPNPGGLPVGGTTIVNLPNNHLQYAVTWYGLAAALAVVVAAWLVRRLRHRA